MALAEVRTAIRVGAINVALIRCLASRRRHRHPVLGRVVRAFMVLIVVAVCVMLSGVV